MTNQPPREAHAAVVVAFAGINLTELPDPDGTWTTSSAPESHPGKRFHASSYCRQLWKIKRPQTVTRRYSEIGDRVCWECFSHADVTQRQGAYTYHLRAFVRVLHQIARDLDAVLAGDVAATPDVPAGGQPAAVPMDQVTASLETLERDLRGQRSTECARSDYHRATLDAVKTAANALRQLTVSQVDPGTAAAHRRFAAAQLLCTEEMVMSAPNQRALTGQPGSAVDLRRLGGTGQPGFQKAYRLNDAFAAFIAALQAGDNYVAARAAAAPKAKIGKPGSVSELPETLIVPAGATELALSDVIDQWRDQATATADAVLDEWVNMAQANEAAYADLGEIEVDIPSAARQGTDHITEKHIKMFATAYPYRVGVNGARLLTVPAVIAAWLERLARFNAYAVSLNPAGENTAEVLEVTERLRIDDPGLSLATALAAARGIAAAPVSKAA